MTADSASIRRFAGIALVAGLSCAGAAAVLPLLTGSFDETDTRVILTSIGFAVASATGSAGAAARLRPSSALWLLGTLTLLASVLAFLLLLAGLWTNLDEWGDEGVWRAFGVVAVLGVAGSHACVMLGAMRRTDGEAIRLLTLSSVSLSAFDTLAVIAPFLGLVDDVDEAWGRIFGAALVQLVLTSVLPPTLRRMRPVADPAGDFLATGNRAPEIQAEVKRPKKVAQRFET